MKISLLFLFLFTAGSLYAQDFFDTQWTSLKFEQDSKLNVHKKKIQVAAYTAKDHYALGDTILFTVEVNRAIKPDWNSLIAIPNLTHIASSTSLQYGTTSKENRYAWVVYRVKYLPVSAGEFYIEPIAIPVENKSYATKKVKISIE